MAGAGCINGMINRVMSEVELYFLDRLIVQYPGLYCTRMSGMHSVGEGFVEAS